METRSVRLVIRPSVRLRRNKDNYIPCGQRTRSKQARGRPIPAAGEYAPAHFTVIAPGQRGTVGKSCTTAVVGYPKFRNTDESILLFCSSFVGAVTTIRTTRNVVRFLCPVKSNVRSRFEPVARLVSAYNYCNDNNSLCQTVVFQTENRIAEVVATERRPCYNTIHQTMILLLRISNSGRDKNTSDSDGHHDLRFEGSRYRA